MRQMSGEGEGRRDRTVSFTNMLFDDISTQRYLVSKAKLSIVSKIPITLGSANFSDNGNPLACPRKFIFLRLVTKSPRWNLRMFVSKVTKFMLSSRPSNNSLCGKEHHESYCSGMVKIRWQPVKRQAIPSEMRPTDGSPNTMPLEISTPYPMQVTCTYSLP